jgi:hypothetical protein
MGGAEGCAADKEAAAIERRQQKRRTGTSGAGALHANLPPSGLPDQYQLPTHSTPPGYRPIPPICPREAQLPEKRMFSFFQIFRAAILDINSLNVSQKHMPSDLFCRGSTNRLMISPEDAQFRI